MKRNHCHLIIVLLVCCVLTLEVFANVEFSLTYQWKRPLEQFLMEMVVVTSHRLCALACKGANFCQSFTYHLRGRLCVLLVTDSRLLDDPSLLGVPHHKPGLDWVQGEMLRSVRGCGDQAVIGECLRLGPLGDGDSFSLTSQWSFPSIDNLQYPVDITLTRIQHEKTCGQNTYSREEVELPLSSDMRFYKHEGLVPGLSYSFALKAHFRGVQSQVELSYSDVTPVGAPTERSELRATDPYSVVFTFDIHGCTEKIYYWYSPPNTDCNPSCMLNYFDTSLVLRITGLSPGTGYDFYFIGEANGLNSSALVINQFTDPSFVLTMAVSDIDLTWMSFLYTMEGPGGSSIEVTYTGQNSGHFGVKELPFVEEGWLTLDELMSGEQYEVVLVVFGFGNSKNNQRATLQFQTRLGDYSCEPNTVTATNDSISFNCSNVSHVYKLTIESTDMPGGPWTVFPDGDSAVIEVTGLTPGLPFTGKVTPSTAGGLTWDPFWVYATLYTGYFTVEQTVVGNDNMTLEITVHSGGGEEVSLFAIGVIDEQITFQQKTTFTLINLNPGKVYNLTLTITGKQLVDATNPVDAKVSSYSVLQATVPLQTYLITQEMKDEPETCTTKTFPFTAPQRFFLRYGVDNEVERITATTLVLDVVQEGEWEFIVFNIFNVDKGTLLLDDVHVPNDPSEFMYFLDTSLPIFDDLPIWSTIKVTLTAKSLGVTAPPTIYEYKSDTMAIIPQPTYPVLWGNDVTFSWVGAEFPNYLVVFFEHSEDAGDPVSHEGQEFTHTCGDFVVCTIVAAVYDPELERIGFANLFNFISKVSKIFKCGPRYKPEEPKYDWDGEYLMYVKHYNEETDQVLYFEWVIPSFILRCDYVVKVFAIPLGSGEILHSNILTDEKTYHVDNENEWMSTLNPGRVWVEVTCFYDYLGTKPTHVKFEAVDFCPLLSYDTLVLSNE